MPWGLAQARSRLAPADILYFFEDFIQKIMPAGKKVKVKVDRITGTPLGMTVNGAKDENSFGCYITRFVFSFCTPKVLWLPASTTEPTTLYLVLSFLSTAWVSWLSV